ncbi:hypothetical protein [Chakrabartyella piscis]|uniref:hypothetical protein n=1 Tax=Chakrabartyella piscis TaxID=2918914 RepID=UPI002958C072|nr:hypothetical protein [Chakrabartyella piscis]
MKLAVIGSRSLTLDISPYIPENVTEIISGGAKGIDTCAEQYADAHKISKHIILPQYNRYKRGAPIKRNEEMIQLCDMVLAFWDGKSKGTESSIAYAKKIGKEVQVIMV